MLNRTSVATLLTLIVVVMAACIVAFLAFNAWHSFDRLRAAGRSHVRHTRGPDIAHSW